MDLLSHRAFNLFIYLSRRAFCKNQPCVLTMALLYNSRREKKVASAERKRRSNFNRKYVFFPLFFRLTESHRKAIRVIQRMRYLVAKRNFQVSPNLSGKIWCSVIKATCWGDMNHRPDISVWSSTTSGWCGVWLEFRPIFIDLLCRSWQQQPNANIVSNTERGVIHLWGNKLSGPLWGFLDMSHSSPDMCACCICSWINCVPCCVLASS